MPTSRLSAVSVFAPGEFRYPSSVMLSGLDYLNDSGKPLCLGQQNDTVAAGWYDRGMAKIQPDAYVEEWLAYFGKSQADVVNDLDWNKAKVSLICKGKQRYHRDDINDLAAYLHLEPFELLLPPDRAMAMRQYRASAAEVVKLAPEQAPAIDIHDVKFERDKAREGKRHRRTGTNG